MSAEQVEAPPHRERLLRLGDQSAGELATVILTLIQGAFALADRDNGSLSAVSAALTPPR